MGHLNYAGRNYYLTDGQTTTLSNILLNALQHERAVTAVVVSNFLDYNGNKHMITSELVFSAGIPISINDWDVPDSELVEHKNMRWDRTMLAG